MSYTPKTWNTGDTVTASDMNNIEQGIANAGVMVVEYDHTTQSGVNYYHYFDKTYAEVETALKNNIPVYYRAGDYGTTANPTIFESSLFPIFMVRSYGDNPIYYEVVGINAEISNYIFVHTQDKNSYLCISVGGK